MYPQEGGRGAGPDCAGRDGEHRREAGGRLTNAERVKLLFGPYQAPPLKRGDRAVCLFRDCELIITGWTDARIPWPRWHALDSSGPGSGLLVNEELARAVRRRGVLVGGLPLETLRRQAGRAEEL